MDNQFDTVDLALGRGGQPPRPFVTGLSEADRANALEASLCNPDNPLPSGELAEWALVLIHFGKEAAAAAAASAVASATKLLPTESPELPFVRSVLTELHMWNTSDKDIEDLRRLGDLWWSLLRNPPVSTDTPLGHAAVMAWFVAGYDPEGWGNPPENETKLATWLDEAANNTEAIVDVFGCVEQAVGSEGADAIIQSVRSAVARWRDKSLT